MSPSKHRKVLLVQRSANLDGSALSGLLSAQTLCDVGFDVTVVFGYEGDVIERYKNLGCKVLISRHGDWLRPGGYLRSVRRIAKERRLATLATQILQRLQPDYVYINSLVSYSFAIAAKKLGLPVLWHIRELFSDVGGEMSIPRCGGKWFVRRELERLTDVIVVNSAAVRENVCGNAMEKSVTIVPNAVDTESFRVQPEFGRRFRQRYGLPCESFLIGVPSTLRPMKGQLFFIECIPALLASIENLHVVFLGDCSVDYAVKVRKRVAELGLMRHVSFIGSIDQMAEFYAAVDMVVIPSQAEPFGRVAIEAFAANKVVVASAVGGLKEIVLHGHNGLLASSASKVEFVRSIQELHQSPVLASSLAAQARRDALEKFSVSAYHSRIRALVEKIVK